LFGARLGRDVTAVRSRIGLIAHQTMLYRDLTARENLEFFGRLYGIRNPAGRARMLLEVIGLSGRADDPIKAFSRGMTQRVAIARALMHDPELLLADEPFDGLDAPSVEATEHLLAHLNRAGKTILLVNHDVRQSLRLTPRMVVLRGGRVVMDRATDGLDAAGVLAEVSGQ
jgi:heme exporter protein A